MASLSRPRAERAGTWTGMTRLGWRPGRGTALVTTIAAVVAVWLFSPIWWSQLGQDSGVYFVAATVVRDGGNPYDSAVLAAAEQRLSGGDSAHPVPTAGYANPPLFTLLLEPLTGLSARAFWGVIAISGLVGGLLGFEAILASLSWKSRPWPRVGLLVAPEFALALFLGNVSPLLLAMIGGGLLAMRRDRPWLAGVALSLTWLKPSVGLPLALAVIVLGPGRRAVVAASFALATGALLVLDLLLTGVPPLVAWLRLLLAYGVDPARAARGSAALTESGLAGLPALFSHALGGLAAELLAVSLVVTALLLLGVDPDRRRRVLGDAWLTLALGMAAAFLVMPFSHLNDLVIAAVPILVLASRPLTAASRVALAAVLLGPILILLSGLVVPRGLPSTTAGSGLVVLALVFVALVTEGFRHPLPTPGQPRLEPAV